MDNKKILIIGYGNQAKAWGLNLLDSGLEVCYALRTKSSSFEKARKKNFNVIELTDPKVSEFSTLAMLTPDHTHGEILKAMAPVLKTDARILYAHGYSAIKEELVTKYPLLKHILLAPKAIASELRFQYECEGGLGAFYSLEHVKDAEKGLEKDFIFDFAGKLGINVGPYESTFLEETRADLFSEQSLLCSVLPYASLSCYNKLRSKGISKEMAYFECWYEVKLIAGTMVKLGPEEFFNLISPNALYGSEKGLKSLLGKQFQDNLEDLLNDIMDGKFYKEIDEIDMDSLREVIIKRWRSEELSQVHNELAPRLNK